MMRSGRLTGLYVLAILLFGLPRFAEAVPKVLTVPYALKDLTIPHPAYNGHPTTFKAISRGDCEQPLYRWDIDGNGTWDNCPGAGAGGWVQSSTRYDLSCRLQLPEVDRAVQPKKLFIATVEVKCGANGVSAFGNYNVMVFADVPRGRAPRADLNTYAYSARPIMYDNLNNPIPLKCVAGKCAISPALPVGRSCQTDCYVTTWSCANDDECAGDNEDMLRIKREVAIDDALWFLHKQIAGRSGEGVPTIIGYTNAGTGDMWYSYKSTAVHLWGLAQNGHIPAYPGYVHGNAADVKPLPAGWLQANQWRYDNDPYAEDAARLFNMVISSWPGGYNWNNRAVNDNQVEDPQGQVRIPGTSDGRAYDIWGQYLNGPILGALASSGMAGTTCQTGMCNGHSVEWMVQQVVDGFCNNQTRGWVEGGWGYSTRTDTPVGSLSQWATIGLEAADKGMSQAGVRINRWCKNRIPTYLINYQSAATGSGLYLTSGGHSNNTVPHLTGGLLVGHGWIGSNKLPYDNNKFDANMNPSWTNNQVRTAYDKALAYIGKSWYWAGEGIGGGWEGGNWFDAIARFDGAQKGSLYTHYSLQKGLRTVDPEVKYVTGADGKPIDWYRDYSFYYVNNQETSGATRQRRTERTGAYAYVGYVTGTAWGEVLVLTPTLFNPDPVAVGTASPMTILEGCAGQEVGKVTFTHAGSYHLSPTRKIVDYQWQFEVANAAAPNFDAINWAGIPNNGYSADGKAYHSTSPDATPVHTYSRTGTYTAVLRVVDDNVPPKSNILTIAGIQVTPQQQNPPTANAGGPYIITAGQNLALAGTMADLNQQCNPNEVLTPKWYLNNDQVADFNAISGNVGWAALAALNPALPRNQPFDIRLVVTDSTGKTGEAKTQLTIYDKNPVPCFTLIPPDKAGCSDAVTVDASCTSHQDPRRTFRTFEWQWAHNTDYVAQDPAGFPFVVEAVGKSQSHTYPAIGTYRVTMRVTDDAGGVAIAQKKIIIEARTAPRAVPGGPYVIETWLDAGVRKGGDLVLDGSGSFDPDKSCGDSIASYKWDVDGNNDFADAAVVKPTLTWAQLSAKLTAAGYTPDTYIANPATGQPRIPVVLRVTDTTARIHDAGTSLTIYQNQPVAAFTLLPSPAACNQPVKFDASGSYHGSPLHGIVRYEWDFHLAQAGVANPDPAVVAQNFVVDAQGKTVDHQYPQFGTFFPVLRVTDDQGKTAYQYGSKVEVKVGNSAPQVDIGGPYKHYITAQLNLDASGTVEPDAACGDSVAKYEWDLNGDRVFTDAAGVQPRVQWADLVGKLQTPQQYPADPRTGLPAVELGLKVTDGFGASAVATTKMPIYNRMPVARAVWSPQPAVPINVNRRAIVKLDGTGSYHGHPDYQIVGWSWKVAGAAQTVSGATVDMEVDLRDQPDPLPAAGVTKTLVLRVTDNVQQTADLQFDVLFKQLASNPPTIKFSVGRDGLFIQQGEGFSVNANQTSDPDGNWIKSIAWDVNGDGTNDIVWNRTDTNGDGKIDQNDANPNWNLVLTWAQMAGYPGLQALGEHSIRLTVTDSTGVSASDTVKLTIVEKAMIARAAAVPPSGGCATWFTFDGTQSRHLFPGQAITSYAWDLNNDGVFEKAGATVDHSFGSFNVFTVKLKVKDLAGREAIDTLTVSTRDGNLPPLAVAGGPYFADSVLKNGVQLDASKSTEPDAACGDRIVTYRWDLDNVVNAQGQRTWEIVTAQSKVAAAWALLANIPQNNVNQPIVLEAEDSLGGKALSFSTILVADGTPVAAFTALPAISACGQPTSLDASASYHPVPGKTITKFEWDFDYNGINFVPSAQHVNDQVFQWVFDRMGDHAVALRVTDANARYSIVTHQVTTAGDNLPPIAQVAGSLWGAWGQPLVLNGSASRDPNEACGDTITKWEWDLNNDGAFEISANQATTTVAWAAVAAYNRFAKADPFTEEPSYDVRLRVSDRLGAQGTLILKLRIFDSVPVAKPAVRPAVAGCNVDMVFDGSGSFHSNPYKKLTKFVWDFDKLVDSNNDGNPANDQDAVGPQVTYRYNRMAFTSNPFTVIPHKAQLTVTDENNNTAVAEVLATLSFENFRPVASAGGPYVTTVVNDVPRPINLDGTQSTDPNLPCDQLVKYEWDTDADDKYGAADNDGSALCGATDCVGPTLNGKSDPNWKIGRTYKVSLKVTDLYGLVSDPGESSIKVQPADQVPPTVVLTAPNGGEILKGIANIQMSISHPQGKGVKLEMFVNENKIVFIGLDTVATNANGSPVAVARTFDTTGLANAKDAYRLKVVAALQENLAISSTTLSRAPWTVDNAKPTVNLPANEVGPTITLEQSDQAGTPFTFHPTATDNLDPAPRLTVAPLLERYPLGTTNVTFTATDWAQNSASKVVQVVVQDKKAPQLLTGPNVTKEAVSAAGTPVQLSPSAWDICDAKPVITYQGIPADGFKVGATVVTITATDAAGNKTTGQLTVTITDATPPVVVLPNPPRMTVSQAEPRGTLATSVQLPVPVVTDNGSSAANLSCALFVVLKDANGNLVQPPANGYSCTNPAFGGNYFPAGDTVVTYRVKDSTGNTTQSTFTVSVVNNTAPTVTMVASPRSDIWLTSPASISFKATDAADPTPTVVVAPLPAGVNQTPPPNGQGVYTLTYSADGTYDVRIFVSNDGGNQSVVILDRFGIDRSAPTLEIKQFPIAGVNPNDPNTWPYFFNGEHASPRFSATDLLSGVKSMTVKVSPGGPGGDVTILSKVNALAGTPPSGPNFVGNLACTEQAGVCAGGNLSMAALRPGNQKLIFTSRDGIDNLATLEVPFKIVDLATALGIVRGHLATYLQNQALPAAVKTNLTNIDTLLSTGQASLRRGYLGGCLVSVEDATKLMNDAQTKIKVAAIVQDAELLARGAYSDAAVYWQAKAVGTVEEVPAKNFLDQAWNFIWQDRQYNAAVLSVENAYFYARNAEKPYRATDVVTSTSVLRQITAEMDVYRNLADLPATQEIRSAAWKLDQEVLWKYEDLQEMGFLEAENFITLLLDLQDVATSLYNAEAAGCWVRNWQWGLGQMVRVVVDLAKADAESKLGRADCKIKEAQVQYDRGMSWLDNRQVDLMLDLYANKDIRCLMLEIYEKAEYEPPFPLANYGCVAKGCVM